MTIHSQALFGGFFAMLTLALLLFVLVSAAIALHTLGRIALARLPRLIRTRRSEPDPEEPDLDDDEWSKDFS